MKNTYDPSAPLAPGEKVVWSRTIASGPALIGALAAGGAVALRRRRPVSALVVAGVAAAFGTVRVTIDDRGLTWASYTGVPRGHIPLDEITSAEVVDVEPIAYGGWGLRLMPGRGTALVLRRGPALRVHRSTGDPFTITVDDAEVAAGLLTALVKRLRR